MSKVKIGNLIRTVQAVFTKRSPEILLGIGIASGVTTTILAVKATPKAIRLIEEAERDKACEYNEKHNDSDELAYSLTLTKAETFKVVWKCYIPAAISGAASVACLVGAHSINAKRNAVLATAYKLSETALMEYKNVIRDDFGEEKAKELSEKVMQRRIDNDPVTNREVLITGTGTQLCYDGISGRYFESDLNSIKAAVNKMNETMIHSMYASLNDFYYEIGLSNTELGDMLGWNLDDGLLEISYGSMIANDGRPCITLDYTIAPRYDFANLM